MLIRRYIGKKLSDYYAQPSNRVVGSTSMANINFAALWGEWHWRRLYRRLYKDQEGQWLTPVELFRPYYSNTIARFVLETCDYDVSKGVHIVELGGGRGTNANVILDYLRESHPAFYDQVSYTIIDSSPSLLELQKTTLSSGEHDGKIDFILQDLLEVAEDTAPFLDNSDIPTLVIAMELLDNLPHDKVRRCKTSRLVEQAELRTCDQAVLNGSSLNESTMKEVFVPLQDPCLSQILQLLPSYGGFSGRPTWVPTVACCVLQRLINARPNASLMLIDFDWLPSPDLDDESISQRWSIEADGEPIVTSMNGKDYQCYLNSPPLCDILFPTDFSKLAAFVKKTWDDGAIVTTTKQSVFLQRYGPSNVEATRSWLTGYSPLIHDFGNCSVLTARPNPKRRTAHRTNR